MSGGRDIERVLWETGRSGVREVNEILSLQARRGGGAGGASRSARIPESFQQVTLSLKTVLSRLEPRRTHCPAARLCSP